MNYTCKLPLSGSDCICILNTEWSEKQVNLSLLHANKAWHGKFQLVEVAELLDQLSMSREKYLEETKSALTTHSGAVNFAYSIENDKFIWKKCVGKNMTVKFGSVLISKLPVFEIFEKIIDNTLQSLIDTSNKLAIIGVEKEALEKENSNLKTKCNNIIATKIEMESLLYSQFLCVLNEKKKKIEELKQKLEPSDHLHESDSCHSDNHHFGSETEIDSEEDTRSPIKLEIIGRKGTHDPEKKSTFMLPKRSNSGNQGSVMAGPSRINNQLAQNNSKDEVPPEKLKVLRKPQRNRCTEKSTVIDIKKVNSEEDEFSFPKKSRKTTNFTEIATASKIIYDSENETSIKQESESNSTSDTAKGLVNINFDCENKQYKIERSYGAKNNLNRSDDINKSNYEGFSSSTLDILNHLM